jgi:precorrin-6Y C5,15-methyltransferase (decarboxylating)
VTAAVTVVGLHGGVTYGPRAAAALLGADLVVGSARHLAATQGRRSAGAAELVIAGDLDAVVARVADARGAGRRVCVLASGDPGFFGIVRVLEARLGAGSLEVHPAPSSVALAFARIGRSWDDALVVSAHGRPLADAVRRVVTAPNPSVAVLTSPALTPEVVGRALVEAGEPPCPVTVASRLGETGETVTATDLAGLAAGAFAPLSVVVLHRRPAAGGPGLSWGLPDRAFEHRDGMITKAEVRAVALGKLGLPPSGVLWDVGAGSGSVGVEGARLAPGLHVLAIDRDRAQLDRVALNATRHGVTVTTVAGEAPACLAALPDPDRIFVGGGGPAVVAEGLRRLRPGGRIVATYAVMERAVLGAAALGHLVQVAVSRGVPTGDIGLRLRAENPVFVCWGPGD